jgi:hypothetical protein
MSQTPEDDVRLSRATEKKASVSRATAATSGILLQSTWPTSAITPLAKNPPTYRIGEFQEITITLLSAFELTLVHSFVICGVRILRKRARLQNGNKMGEKTCQHGALSPVIRSLK